tara:strand:- start:4049 stop:4459 length:411 start_codon:yes stop_codon:yes gene_type:complete
MLKVNNVVNLGGFAYLKYGPDNITLYHLASAEELGLWGDTLNREPDRSNLSWIRDKRGVTKEMEWYMTEPCRSHLELECPKCNAWGSDFQEIAITGDSPHVELLWQAYTGVLLVALCGGYGMWELGANVMTALQVL